MLDSERQSLLSMATASTSSSANRFQSSRGIDSFQSFFSRRSSASHGDISGDREFGTASIAGELSPSPGRRGPLGEAARADLRAVKKVGACWRCKVLRKKVGVLHRPQK
jgi:hypothetical protein